MSPEVGINLVLQPPSATPPSAGKLRVDYLSMYDWAIWFKSDAATLRLLYSEAKKRTESLHGAGWAGLAADKWFGDMENVLLPKTQQLAKIMDDLDVTLRNIHDLYKSAEQEAAALFKMKP